MLIVSSFLLTGEIEEQLRILEDLVPNLISKKAINGGQILYRQVLFVITCMHPFCLVFQRNTDIFCFHWQH